MKRSTKSVVFKIEKEQRASGRVVWNPELDAQLEKLVVENGGRCWKRVAEKMQTVFKNPALTTKKCRERWCNCANPKFDKSPLTETEELLLLVHYDDDKNKWAVISRKFNNRSSIKVKNEFFNSLRKAARKIKYSEVKGSSYIFAYIEGLYFAVLLYEMLSLKKSSRKDKTDFRAYLYDNVTSKSLSQEQCLTFIWRSTEELLSHYSGRTMLQNLRKINFMPGIKDFLYRLFQQIKVTSSLNGFLTETILLSLVEFQLSEDLVTQLKSSSITATTPLQLQTLPPTPLAMVEPEMGGEQSMCGGCDSKDFYNELFAPRTPMNKETAFAPCFSLPGFQFDPQDVITFEANSHWPYLDFIKMDEGDFKIDHERDFEKEAEIFMKKDVN